MQQDLVSIIMPSYNTGRFIKDTIDSVLAQTHTNWELIIVDDCSTDNTDEVVSTFHDERIKYIKNEKNSGAAVSRNRALREAKGKWIAFLDSDDLWEPQKLEKQIMFMVEHGYHFSYTNYVEINEDSTPNGKLVTGPKRVTKRGMYNYCWPGCLTVMYNAETVGLIQIADIKKNNDYAMWLKVCKKANCYLLDETLARYRKRSGSISNHGYMKLIKWHYKLYREAENKNPISATFLTVRNLFFGVIKKTAYKKNAHYTIQGKNDAI
ncbi:MAG: glycosyltransferase family 2 protein [Ruminococcaceae bacterium]|nr:glycosyltransferase family 2 protein [Oscillospiraceae bacterium]